MRLDGITQREHGAWGGSEQHSGEHYTETGAQTRQKRFSCSNGKETWVENRYSDRRIWWEVENAAGKGVIPTKNPTVNSHAFGQDPHLWGQSVQVLEISQEIMSFSYSLLQCSWLENPRDGGAWWATVYGVAQSQAWLKQLSSSSSSSYSLIVHWSTHSHLTSTHQMPTTWCMGVRNSSYPWGDYILPGCPIRRKEELTCEHTQTVGLPHVMKCGR